MGYEYALHTHTTVSQRVECVGQGMQCTRNVDPFIRRHHTMSDTEVAALEPQTNGGPKRGRGRPKKDPNAPPKASQ
ncbi:unnamed protein product, partial [Oppiella nova]